MSDKFAPQRRKLLALESERSPGTGLIVHPSRQRAAGRERETALSIPEAVRDLGEPLEPFFEACGGRQTISLSVRRFDNRPPAETFVFQQPFVIVGRCRESDLYLDGPGINFRHLYLQLVAGQWMFFDLRMIAGGAASDEQRSPWGRFDSSDELRVGPWTISRAGTHTQPSVLVAGQTTGLERDLPGMALEFITGGGNSRPDEGWGIDRAVTLVGSSRQCDLWLRDESVSKVHASLVLTGRGLWVVDLIGKGSVLVNGRPAYWKQVHDGSVLQIGRYRFRVRFDAPLRTHEIGFGGRPIPEILPAGDDQARHGGLADPTVAALLGQMAAMQNQFFEHSQNQMQFMGELLAQLGKSQQASVRHDMERIGAITRELEQLRSQLAGQPDQLPERSPHKKTGSRPNTSAPETSLPVSPGSHATAASRPDSDTSGRQSSACRSSEPCGSSEGGPAPPAAAEAHARLTERMARLARERNAGWLRILDVFNRKPQGRTGE